MLASLLIPPSTACCPSSRFRLRELRALGDLCVNSVSFFQRSTLDCQLSSSPSPNSFPASPLESALEKPAKKTHLSTFRMNTSKSVSKQRTLSSFRMNTYGKQGRGWPVIVNQESFWSAGARSRFSSITTAPQRSPYSESGFVRSRSRRRIDGRARAFPRYWRRSWTRCALRQRAFAHPLSP